MLQVDQNKKLKNKCSNFNSVEKALMSDRIETILPGERETQSSYHENYLRVRRSSGNWNHCGGSLNRI